MKMKKYGICLFLCFLALIGCACGDKTEQETMEAAETAAESDASDMFTDRDLDPSYDESTAVAITFQGNSATCNSDKVTIDGTTVTITDEGTYLLSGTLNNGMVIVDAEDTDKPQLVLNGADITSDTSAPLYISEADKVFLTLAEGSENTLTNGGTFIAIDENNIDGTIFSKQDLTINGNGSLALSSPAGHGIVCKDDLVFTGGTTTITSSSHGIDANDSLRATAATLTIAAGKDGIHAENNDDTTLGFVYMADGTFEISAEGDGISAGAHMQLLGGTYDILTGGGSENADQQTSESRGIHGGGMGGDPGMGGGPGGGDPGARSTSATTEYSTETETADTSDTSAESTGIKGLKAAADLSLLGGTFTIDSADDAIHSNASITISGGTLNIASGDDGIHADDTLTVTAGTIDISQSYEGLEALHIDVSGGDITALCTDDGLNAAGGTDSSGYGGRREPDQFGGSGNANGTIVIRGGSLNLTASGDGIDANGSIEISGGDTIVSGPTTGDTATMDYDTEAVIRGGTFIGTGAYQMAQTFSGSEQGVIALSVGNQSAGTAIRITDANGSEVLTYTPTLNYGVVIFSSPDLKKGETYTLTVGSSSGQFEAY